MDASPTMITIRSILGASNMPADAENHLQDFLHHLSRHAFRPLPNQFITLPIVGALGRWSDLNPAVRQRLSDEIVLRWKAIADTSKEDPAGNASSINEADMGASRQNQDPAPHLSTMAILDPASGNGSPLIRMNPRRDWFDTLLDAVAACIMPTYVSSK